MVLKYGAGNKKGKTGLSGMPENRAPLAKALV
jgi:hypothetical protein